MDSYLSHIHWPESQVKSTTSGPLLNIDSDRVQTTNVSLPSHEHNKCEEQVSKVKPKPGINVQHLPSPSTTSKHADDSGEIVITNIRATDVALGLGRISAGFYVMVRHSGFEWKTEDKGFSVKDNDVEWDWPIPIPHDLSATVCFAIYAPFQSCFVGYGELLRELKTTVGELLGRSGSDTLFMFSEGGGIASPCSSLLVTVQRVYKREDLQSRVLGPWRSTTRNRSEMENATEEGHNALLHYRKGGEKQYLERSIEQFELALNHCPLDHPHLPVLQSNLAMAKFIHCQANNSDVSLDIPLTLYQKALSARPIGHLDRPALLIQLAKLYVARFEKLRDEVDSSQAEALLREARELSSADSYYHLAATSILRPLLPSQWGIHSTFSDEEPVLSNQLLEHYDRHGNVADLQRAISLLQRFIYFPTARHSGQYPLTMVDFGGALLRRFYRLGVLDDLDEAILRINKTVDLIPNDDPDKPSCLNKLGNCYRTRFECLGHLGDIEQAIVGQQRAFELALDNHPDRACYLSDLGTSFFTRYFHRGELGDLEQAIAKQREALHLTSNEHPATPHHLNVLGNSLKTRFSLYGEPSDLQQAILRHQDAVYLTPDGHIDKPRYLNDLGSSFCSRFYHFGELSDLEQAISRQRNAIELIPDGHIDKPRCLDDLGRSFFVRFEHLGEPCDLEQAISRLRAAVELTPDRHPGKINYLSELSRFLTIRFNRLGEFCDLEQAISRQQDALDITPKALGRPINTRHLCNTSLLFLTRFDHFKEFSDLEQAISKQHEIVDIIPDCYIFDKAQSLCDLGNSYLALYDYLGELCDLETAISMCRDAAKLIRDGHPSKHYYLHLLGRALLFRFKRLGDICDLEQAISKKKDALDLVPYGHPARPRYLSDLCDSFVARFEHLKEPGDLERVISRQSDALELTPDDHPEKPRQLNDLGNSFRARYEHLKKLSDLDYAISSFLGAVAITPDGHFDKPCILFNLGESLQARFEHVGDKNDLEQAISSYSHAASASFGPLYIRFCAALRWISCARISGRHSLLHPYSYAIRLLPQLAWIGLSLSDRYKELIEASDIVREAAAVALESGHPEVAVEWLEQGRSIVWGELSQLRSPYDELSAIHPDHAQRLRRLSASLEKTSTTRERFISSSLELAGNTKNYHPESLQREGHMHRALALDRDQLLNEIRRLPGFETFLLNKDFSQLRAAAHSGPVVILNAAERRRDAIIIFSDVENAIHVPLPDLSLERITDLQFSVKNLVRRTRAEREGHPTSQGHPSKWALILASLWRFAVKPVLDAIACVTPGKQLRIFWCPTGSFAFLPIHAAGLYHTRYSQPGHKVFDFVVSSYVPTLSILTPPPSPVTIPGGDLRLLAIPQPSSDGLPHLPGVNTELECIKAVLRNSSAQTTYRESVVGTVEEVLALMKEVDWVHFACHGVQDRQNPTQSGLCLADGRRLKLTDIIALSRPRGGLAFLSACQTATGDRNLSDEAIHIAAGMLFAGYAGVVGTMWSISDRFAPVMVKDVYEQLFQGGAGPDYRDAARALQDAVGRLRERGASFGDWLPFIHVGL